MIFTPACCKLTYASYATLAFYRASQGQRTTDTRGGIDTILIRCYNTTLTLISPGEQTSCRCIQGAYGWNDSRYPIYSFFKIFRRITLTSGLADVDGWTDRINFCMSYPSKSTVSKWDIHIWSDNDAPLLWMIAGTKEAGERKHVKEMFPTSTSGVCNTCRLPSTVLWGFVGRYEMAPLKPATVAISIICIPFTGSMVHIPSGHICRSNGIPYLQRITTDEMSRFNRSISTVFRRKYHLLHAKLKNCIIFCTCFCQ